MTRLIWSVVLLLYCAVVALAAPPVEVPKEIMAEVGDPVTVSAKTEGEVVYFVPLDIGLKVFPSGLLNDKKSTVVWANKPGRYKILVYSAVGKEPTLPAYTVVVVGGEKEKDKEVNPPPPPPTPVTDKPAWVIVVEETMNRTPAIEAVLGDLTFWKRLETKGVKWRFYDKDSPDAKRLKYDQFAAGVTEGLPAVLFLDGSGKVLKVFKLKSQAELEAMIGGK